MILENAREMLGFSREISHGQFNHETYTLLSFDTSRNTLEGKYWILLLDKSLKRNNITFTNAFILFLDLHLYIILVSKGSRVESID